ncbi:serine/threonine protein kinase [Pendulispora brunnea]|uniref:Serine/threonine protein kinase n=1 Tax=Pendulispora brunnea TaxID=2905690 RepID=A0ABZ2KEP2_9BACT
MLEDDALGWNLGRYTLHGEIASGGMASVHIGRMVASAGFSKVVAIKRLHEEFAGDPDFVTMFLDEARLAARVHHPNVVQPLDVLAEGGEVFLVMEYVRGETLAKLQRILRPMGEKVPLPVAGAIVVGVLHGLHAAHEARSELGEPLGIVHRDVSPQNVLVGTDGTARVLDFGIAKASDRAAHTREGDLKGKIAYMAPEQLAGETELDRRTDIFAASVVLWELLTGRRLYESESQPTLLTRSRSDIIQPPSRFSPEVPSAVDEVVRKGLSRAREDRFASAREMAIALERVMPLATPSTVGEWVEEIAHESLLRRAARIAEIEQGARAPESVREQAHALLQELQITRTRERRSIVPAPRSSAMGLDDSSPMLFEDSAILVEPLSPLPLEDIPSAPETAPAIPEVMPALYADTEPQFDARVPNTRRQFVIAAVFALLTLGLLTLLLPVFVKRSYVRAAAQRGIALHVDSVDLSFQGVRLLGCAATFPGMPGLEVRAKALDFAAAEGGTHALTVEQPEIALDGAYVPTLDALELYLEKHPLPEGDSGLDRMTVQGGQLAWTKAFGENTRLELEGIRGEMMRANERHLGQDYTFEAERIGVQTPVGSFGPWRGALTHTAASLVANVTLGTDAGEPSTATYMEQGVDGPGSMTTFEAKIPRSAVDRLGIPKSLLGAAPKDALQIEGTVRGVREHAKFEVQSAFALHGSTNVRFQGRVLGNPHGALEIDGGVLTYGAFRGRLWGGATFVHDGFRIEGAWKSAPRPCIGAHDPEPEITVPELAADVRGLQRAVAAPTLPHQTAMGGVFVFDTRDLAQTRVTAVASNHCD